MQLKQDLDDNRTGGRLLFKALVRLQEKQSGTYYSCKSLNVSVSGLEVDVSLPEELLDKDCILSITFPGRTSNLVVDNIEGRVVRTDKKTAGISFKEPLEWFLLFPVYQNKLNCINLDAPQQHDT